jgi:transcriptional regulator with XRE-family HTH domain
MPNSMAMATAHTRTVKARRLGRYLVELRKSYGLNIAEVARDIEVSHMTVRRVEQGLHQTDLAILEKLFDRYQVAYERRMELLDLAAEAFRSGWWLEYDDILHDLFAVMEDEAAVIRSFQAQVVPGILQIDAYARALFEAGLAMPDTLEPQDVEKRVRARRERRAILDRPAPPRVHTIVAEAVLRQQVGGPEVMRAQIRHLAEMAERDSVMVQVLPFDSGAHAGLGGSFIIFEFEHSDDPDVVHSENLSGSVYSESPPAVARFRLAWGDIERAALAPDDSVAMLAALISEG